MVLNQAPAQSPQPQPRARHRLPGTPGHAAPSAGTPLGWPESWGRRESPLDGWQWQMAVPCPVASPSQHWVRPKGCRVPRDGEGRQHPREGIRSGALTSLKPPMHLCVLHCASVSLHLPNSGRLKGRERGWSPSQSPPGPPKQGCDSRKEIEPPSPRPGKTPGREQRSPCPIPHGVVLCPVPVPALPAGPGCLGSSPAPSSPGGRCTGGARTARPSQPRDFGRASAASRQAARAGERPGGRTASPAAVGGSRGVYRA